MPVPAVSRDPEVMSGALCFSGTRVPVQNLFDYLEGQSSLDEFLDDFPSVSREAAIAVLVAPSNELSRLLPLLPQLERALGDLAPRSVTRIGN